MASEVVVPPLPPLTEGGVEIFTRTMKEWGAANGRRFPWRETDDPYLVLVGEVLLQRTRGEHVVKVYKEFIRRWPDPSGLSRARASTIANVIAPLGLPKRAPLLSKLGKELARLPSVPTDPAGLLKLPAVGPYAAHAVPIFARGRELPLADWVIARVLRRYFGLRSSARPNLDRPLWELADVLVSEGGARSLWLGTLDFAAAVCKRTPMCHECPLRRTCTAANA